MFFKNDISIVQMLNAISLTQNTPSTEKVILSFIFILILIIILLLFLILRKNKIRYFKEESKALPYYNYPNILLQEKALSENNNLSYIPLNTQLGKSKVVRAIILSLVIAMVIIPFSAFLI